VDHTGLRRALTGVNALALGFGLNEEAFTFNLFAAAAAAAADEFGEADLTAGEATADTEPFGMPALATVVATGLDLEPLNGGIGWMNMTGFDGFEASVLAIEDAAATGFAVPEGGVAVAATVLLPDDDEEGTLGFREASATLAWLG